MSLEEPVTWRQQDTERWLSVADRRERDLQPVLDHLLQRAALRPGERVLDVGCGTGPTTAAAARGVRPGGSVVGLDLAPELVAEARRRVAEPEVTWLVGDATVVDLEPASFDVVLSRFGVMFFADPGAAFAHLAELTRPGGRLAVTVWPPRPEVLTFSLTYGAVVRALEEAGRDYEPLDPHRGPSSLGDRASTTALLRRTGWGSVSLESGTAPMVLARPGDDLGETARAALATGPAHALLGEHPEEVREAATAHLTEEYAARVGDGELRLEAAFLVLTATRS